MWTWIYGIFVSMYMLLHELSDSVLVRLSPLWTLFVCTIVAAVYRLYYGYQLRYISFVASTGFFVALLTTLRETGIVATVSFVVSMNVVLFIVALLYVIVQGKVHDIPYMSTHDKCLYFTSFVTSVCTYSLFYGLEYGLVTPPVTLLFFSIVVICEWLIVQRLYEGTDDIQDEFNRHKALERLNYAICVLVIFICAVAHYVFHASDVFLYSTALVVYLLGGIRAIYANRDIMYDGSCFGLELQKTRQLLKTSDDV